MQQNFPIRTGETAFLFLQHFIKSLKAGGRGAIVIKNTFLSNSDNASVSLRKLLLESCNLYTILDCPGGTFQGAGVKTVVLFFEKGSKTRKIWYYQLDPGRNLGKGNPLNDDDLTEFICLQKTLADSPKSWSVDIGNIDPTNFDLSVTNPDGGKEVTHRSPSEIMEEIARLDTESAEVLENIKTLLCIFTRRGEGWKETRLESLGAIKTGKRDANHQMENGPYPFYTCAFGQFKSPTFSFDGASIILPGNGANVGKVFFFDGKFEAYQRTYVINELSPVINARFLYYCFIANWPEWISTRQFGSATNYIVVGDLKAFPVPTPSLQVQEETVKQLESFTAETKRLASTYERKLADLDELKKSLLHQAFTTYL